MSKLSDTNKAPVRTTKTGQDVAENAKRGEIDAFLSAVRSIKPSGATGRVLLALDATMSRQPTWDLASSIQCKMFESASRSGALRMQLLYFRGHGECRASRWVTDGGELAVMMSKVSCRAGQTQIGRVLRHALKENEAGRLNAVIYIGDAMEEDADALGAIAGKLGVRGVPVFVFQEGNLPGAEPVFREIARLTRGGWFRFDVNSPQVLSDLLASIALYATGGLKALEARKSSADVLLIGQMKGGKGKPT